MKWFESQSDAVKGIIVLLLSVALSMIASWCSNSHARGHRFISSSAKVKVPHVKSYRPRVAVRK